MKDRISAELIGKYMNIVMADLSDRRWARAEAVCQMVLDHGDENHVGALNGLGVVAWNLGLAEAAERFFGRAAELVPENKTYQANFEQARAQAEKGMMERGRGGPGPRLLLSKAWGMGFWSDVDHVLGCLLLSEITGRIPVVHWGENSFFSDDPNRDAWGNFFLPVSNVSLGDFEFANLECFPPKWRGDLLGAATVNKWKGAFSRLSPVEFLNRAEPLVVCDFFTQVVGLVKWIQRGHALYGMSAGQLYKYLIGKYLRPVAEVSEAAERIAAEHFAGRRVVAVHMRGSDKRREMAQLDEINLWTIQKLDEIAGGAEDVIFAMTDSQPIAEDLVRRYGARVMLTRCARSTDDVGVHYKENTGQKMQRGREVMLDTYLAAKADQFVGNGWSGPSAMVEHLKEWPAGTFHLMAPNHHYYRNFIIYGTDDLKPGGQQQQQPVNFTYGL